MRRAGSIMPLLVALTGPIAWAAHFSLLYGAATLACLTSDANETAFQIFAAAVTLAMVGGLSWFVIRRIGALRSEQAPDRFLDMVAAVLAAISALAIVWTAFPVAMIGHCAA